MKLLCRFCYNYSIVPDTILDHGYEAFECEHCMTRSFVPDRGLAIYMARTNNNEPKSYQALAEDDGVFVWLP